MISEDTEALSTVNYQLKADKDHHEQTRHRKRQGNVNHFTTTYCFHGSLHKLNYYKHRKGSRHSETSLNFLNAIITDSTVASGKRTVITRQ